MRPYTEEREFNLTSEQYQNNKIQKGYWLLNRYEIISRLGFGTYGQVFEAHDKQKLVAIKFIHLKKLYENNHTDPQKMRKIILREEENMKKINKINSEHIVKYYQSMINKEGTIKAIIMERCQGPTLSLHIRELRKRIQKGPSEKQSLEYIYQIAKGLNDLHNLGIMHRDLHPGNIMLHKGKLIIIDLGLSKLMTMSQKIQQATILGNPITVAPEIVDPEHKYGTKVDVWSLGVIFFFLLTAGKYPFKIQIQNANSQTIHEHIKSVLQLQFNQSNRQKSRLSKSKVSDNIRNFLQKLLCFKHQQRYNIKKVLEDDIFEGIRKNDVMIDQKQEEQILYKNEEYMNNYMGE